MMSRTAAGQEDRLDNRLHKQLIDCAAGRIQADLVLKNGRIIHVFTGEVALGDIAVINGYIAGVGEYGAHGEYAGKEEVDLAGCCVSPGFIDGHIHIESSLLTPSRFAAAVVPCGTTAVVCDPHEIANVCGKVGVDFMLSRTAPLTVYGMVPSCVPATHMESSGFRLSVDDIDELLERRDIIGLAEMMNFPGTVAGDSDVLAKIFSARSRGVLIDGHAPGVSGKALQAYVAAGVSSDHECTTLAEAWEKLRAGMTVFIREGSTARNLEALLPLFRTAAVHRCLLVTDDRHADDLVQHGHMDFLLRRAVELGADAVTAVQMVTVNPARHFRLDRLGAVAPGYKADLVVFEDLKRFRVGRVYCAGECVAENGNMLAEIPDQKAETFAPALQATVRIRPDLVDLGVPVVSGKSGKIRVITCADGQITTGQALLRPKIRKGFVLADPDRDILKVAVIERHHGTHNVGIGFVQGFGFRDGAIASTVAHDSHNLIVVGTDDASMMLAIKKILEMQGGLVVTGGGRVIEALPLPVAGLMTTEPAEKVCDSLQKLERATKKLGITLENPFMLLSFLALPVIPELKITDKGLVDVLKFSTVPLQRDTVKNKKIV
ncbi:Adenine deaminase [Candidatus Electrothrix marina]|uniref:Adenine deaminase n=1 Tax=Candidatus Electrothrix marina TaxID=1859130 RepID=A0A3S3UHF7_9BACT|nr:Adenine deaminase [Candidatus Electrothrix marina]